MYGSAWVCVCACVRVCHGLWGGRGAGPFLEKENPRLRYRGMVGGGERDSLFANPFSLSNSLALLISFLLSRKRNVSFSCPHDILAHFSSPVLARLSPQQCLLRQLAKTPIYGEN